MDRTIYNALMERKTTLRDVRVHTDIPGLDLVPSNIDLSAAEVQLVSEVAREQTLLRVLADVRDEYDYILIDCQPSLGLLTVNASHAAQGVIIPLEAMPSARGVALPVDTIDKVKERLNPSLEISDPRDHVRLADVCTAARCSMRSRPSTTWCSRPSSSARCASRRPRSPGSRSPRGPPPRHAAAYRDLAKEVLAPRSSCEINGHSDWVSAADAPARRCR